MLKLRYQGCSGDAGGGRAVVVLFLAASLGACKTWYKQGADADEYDIEQMRCAELTGSDAGQTFLDCMAEAGWESTTLSVTVTEPGASDVESADEQEQAEGDGSRPMAVQGDAASAEKGSDGASDNPARAFGAVDVEAAPVSRSWFQMGAGDGDLQQDEAACKANAAGQQSFDRCMRDKGWQALNVHMAPDR